jgi:uncharacterized SAM-binding protein YcdF (DUF218 family)
MKWGWLAPVLPWLVFAFSVWRDPRKMRTAVYLFAALAVTLVGSVVVAFAVVTGQLRAYLVAGSLALIGLAVVALSAVLVANGVTMVRREGLRPRNLLSCALGLAISAYVGLCLAAVPRGAQGMMPWLLALTLPIGFFAAGFTAYLIYAQVYQWGARRFAKPPAAVIVLGSGLIGDRVPPLLASRLDQGRRVLERAQAADPSAVLVTSGGQGPGEDRPEAAAMADYLVAAGVAAAAVWPEEASRSTEENLANSARLLRERGRTGRLAVVTNDFHAFRAALLMRKLKLSGYAVGAPTAGYFWPNAVIREYSAIVRDHWLVNLLGAAASCLPLGLMILFP